MARKSERQGIHDKTSMGRHRKSGKNPNAEHFTGKKGGKKTRRKGLTRKQRKKRRGTHKNRYANKRS